jgi:hypothetical protein
MRIVWFLIYTFLILTGCASTSTVSQDNPVSIDTIDQIKYATVPIVCGSFTEGGIFNVSLIMGSGFFVNSEGYFLTADHVIGYLDKIDKGKEQYCPAVYMAVGGWTTIDSIHQFPIYKFDSYSCMRNREADVAVCKTGDNPFLDELLKKKLRFLALGTFSGVKDGTPIAFTGFPLDSLRPLTSKGNIASYIEKDKKIVIDKSSWPGASGSPIYLSNGKVVGIMIQRGINDAIGLGYAIPAESVMEFLRTNKIHFDHMK